ncbi:LITAF domain-containing protein-like [Anarhichas minor]|uniref:LITAF domain-containing protein-like n=1 Tax=Anarhichas minor TaxID=65739 RepID=UPI003F740986
MTSNINKLCAPTASKPFFLSTLLQVALCRYNVTHLVVTPALHEVPGQTVCPHCQQSVITNTEHTAGLMTWAVCGGLALFGCFLCCCIPFCVEACQDVEHRCPSCQKVIYVYKRL